MSYVTICAWVLSNLTTKILEVLLAFWSLYIYPNFEFNWIAISFLPFLSFQGFLFWLHMAIDPENYALSTYT